MEFLIADRWRVEAGPVTDRPHVLVSIHAPHIAPPALPPDPNRRETLTLCFDDAEPGEPALLIPEPRLMSERQAVRLWRFIERWRAEVSVVAIHCAAGMSRSPAVAAALAEAYGQDSREYFRRYEPNPHVFETMRKAIRHAVGA